MALDELNVLAAFLAVAKERSFTRAAKRLGVSRSGLSHAALSAVIETLRLSPGR